MVGAQSFIFPRLIELVPGTPGNVVLKKLSSRSGSVVVKQLYAIHKNFEFQTTQWPNNNIT